MRNDRRLIQYYYYGRRVKPTDPVPGKEEGVCLAFSQTRFREIASETVRLSDHVDHLRTSRSASLSGGDVISAPGDSSGFWDVLVEREDGAVMALVEDVMHGKQLVLCATHLFWDPRYPDIKAAQASILCGVVRQFMHRNAGVDGQDAVPVIFAGDFNALPVKAESDEFDQIPPGEKHVSAVYEILSKGHLPTDHFEHPAMRRRSESRKELQRMSLSSHGLLLTSAAVSAWGEEPPFTNKTKKFWGCLDYVFYSRDDFDVVEALEMPYEWQSASSFDALPNERWPSDHLAMAFALRWRG